MEVFEFLLGVVIVVIIGPYLILRYSDYLERGFDWFERFAKRGR